MTRKFPYALALTFPSMMVLTTMACAQDGPFATWGDICNYPGTVPSADTWEVDREIEATALLVGNDQIHLNTDRSYHLDQTLPPNPLRFIDWPDNPPNPEMCSDAPFYGSPRLGTRGHAAS